MIKKYIYLLLLFIPLQITIAEEWKKLVDLNGFWKFNIGDDLEWANYDYDDDDWEEIRVPSSWEDEGYYDYNGYAWYRLKFFVPNVIHKKSVYISLGFIDDVDEVYLNGKLAGSSGSMPPRFETAYNAYRKYPVPPDYFKPGQENVIAVRVYDSRLNGGITSGDISIMIQETFDLELNLEGQWKFKTGDSLKWKEKSFNDSNWDNIVVPSTWEIRGYPEYNGFAWYRKKFTLEKKFKNEKLVLVLGKIDDIDECYLNGKLIGSTGDFRITPKKNRFDNEWSEFRGYYIPEGLIKFGEENTIAVRVYDGYIDGGIYQGPVGITTQDEYRRYWKEKKRKKSIWELIFN
jgi:sialate O-acetylesterase